MTPIRIQSIVESSNAPWSGRAGFGTVLEEGISASSVQEPMSVRIIKALPAAVLTGSVMSAAPAAAERVSIITGSIPDLEAASAANNALSTPTGYRSLEAGMTQLRITTEALAARVDRLNARVSQLMGPDGLAESPTDLRLNSLDLELVGADRVGDTALAAELLDLAADHEITSPIVREIAVRALNSEEPLLRASAARVIAVDDPQLARCLLPPALEREDNYMARVVITAALDAANL
jgi:hypothetical protein